MPRKKAPQKRPNGAGSVYWSSALDRYVGAVTVPDGKRKCFYGPKGDHSATAEMGMNEQVNVYRRKRPTADGQKRLGVFLDEWMRSADYLRANSRATYEWAIGYIKRDPIVFKRLDEIEPVDIRNLLTALKPPPPKVTKSGKVLYRDTVGVDTKKRVRAMLFRVFKEAVDLEILDRNPVAKVKAPKPPRRRMKVWEPDEILHFLREAKSHPLYAMFVLALTTTMGPAELFGLQKGDVHLKGGYLWVNQNLEDVNGKIALGDVKAAERRRRIELPDFTVAALREHLKTNMERGPFVFTSREGKPLRRTNVRRRDWIPLLDRVAAEAEKTAHEAGRTEYRFPRIRFYDLRHSANALMGFLGVPIQVARERMGHSSIKTTDDVYGHLYASMQREVAVKLDRFLEAI